MLLRLGQHFFLEPGWIDLGFDRPDRVFGLAAPHLWDWNATLPSLLRTRLARSVPFKGVVEPASSDVRVDGAVDQVRPIHEVYAF